MSSGKKENTALKKEEDFTSEILAEELQQEIASSSDDSAEEFLKTLKHEMEQAEPSKEGALGFHGDDISNVSSIFPDGPVEGDGVLEVGEMAEEAPFEEDELQGFFTEPETSQEDAHSIFTEEATSPSIASGVVGVEVTSPSIVGAALPQEDPVAASAPQQEEEPAVVESKAFPEAPVERTYDDKTAVVSESVSTADLENVTSLDDVKAGIIQQSIQRNPAIDLKNADYIKFAQEKIKRLEKEVSDLRVEAQELALAGGHFKALAEERELLNRSLEAKIGEIESTSREEKKILNDALEAKETKVTVLQERVESLETELESKYNRLRVRERELESRLEILKQEQDAVATSKDDMILRAKKQNNALTADLERARAQSQRTSSQLQEKEDALRRTIKALKLSLTMLESQKHD